MHMEPVVDRSASIIQIALAEWLAFVNIVEIHVRVYVAKILNVRLSIMCQYVHAFEIIKVIHSLDADQYQKHVSIFKKEIFRHTL